MPFVCYTATGGARMQEGLFSLLQMAKTNGALTLLAKAKLPYISVLTDPTMGGVSASFAFIGDVVIGEPKALIGFAGPRVIENTVREKLPEGFQRSEFLLQQGRHRHDRRPPRAAPDDRQAARAATAPERRRGRVARSSNVPAAEFTLGRLCYWRCSCAWILRLAQMTALRVTCRSARSRGIHPP